MPNTWEVQTVPGGHILHIGSGQTLTWMHGLDPSKNRDKWLEADANIRLMAKSPEMLESLDILSRYLTFGKPIQTDAQYCILHPERADAEATKARQIIKEATQQYVPLSPLMGSQVGDPVEFDTYCPHCGKLDGTIAGTLIDIDTDEHGAHKGTVDTGKTYVGSDEHVIYSVRFEKLRRQWVTVVKEDL